MNHFGMLGIYLYLGAMGKFQLVNLKGGDSMFFKIIARDQAKSEAFAERIEDYEVLSDNRVMVYPYYGSCYFTDIDSIIQDPVIVRRCTSDWLYKIKLTEGE